jgi:hypothetical protein
MTDDELKDYATTLLLEHARDVQYLSIFEMAEEHLGEEISDEDAEKVDKLMAEATITVTFKEA